MQILRGVSLACGLRGQVSITGGRNGNGSSGCGCVDEDGNDVDVDADADENEDDAARDAIPALDARRRCSQLAHSLFSRHVRESAVHLVGDLFV